MKHLSQKAVTNYFDGYDDLCLLLLLIYMEKTCHYTSLLYIFIMYEYSGHPKGKALTFAIIIVENETKMKRYNYTRKYSHQILPRFYISPKAWF